MMNEHLGRVALVTGGPSGIGHGATIELVRQGAKVAVHGLILEETEQVAAIIQGMGGSAIAVNGSIADSKTMQRAVTAMLGVFGRLDTLVTSAGIQRYGDIESTDESKWGEVFDVNVKGVFLAIKSALLHIRKSTTGSIVIIASVQASATQRQVTVANWGMSHPIGRVPTIEEIDSVISFVASPRASFMTGEDIRVNGGLLAGLPAHLPSSQETDGMHDSTM